MNRIGERRTLHEERNGTETVAISFQRLLRRRKMALICPQPGLRLAFTVVGSDIIILRVPGASFGFSF